MQYGYARVSTNEQETALQLDALHRAGVTNIHQEKGSARKTRRVLNALLASLGEGDELVVYKVDRMARSIRDLSNLLEHTQAVGASFRSLTEPFDTRTAAGRMMVQLLGVFAEFEWHMIRERSIAGLEAAAGRGTRIGRPRTFTPEQEAKIYRDLQRGKSKRELSEEYNVHESCILRVRLRIDRPDARCVARRFA